MAKSFADWTSTVTRTEWETVIIARGLATARHKPKCQEGGILSIMWNKFTDREALTICDQIRDRLISEDKPLVERLRESDALAQVMNLAQTTIERKEQNNL